MSQESQPRAIVTREVTQRDNPDIKMIPPAKDSPMKRFEATWSDQERSDELKDWRRERVGQYIQALSESLALMFSSIEDASCKTLVSLCLDMKGQGVEALDFNAVFEGTYFGVASESYAGRLELRASAPSASPGGEERLSTQRELAAALGEPSDEPERLSRLWADPKGCLALYDQLRLAFKDGDGTKSAGRAAFLLMHLEQLSQRRSEDSSVGLEGLSEGRGAELETGASARVSRREAGVNAPAPRRKM